MLGLYGGELCVWSEGRMKWCQGEEVCLLQVM